MTPTAGDPSNHSANKPAIDDDIAFQRRIWRFERVGWFVMGVVIAAALAGLFGPGPLSSTEINEGPLRIEYERFQRHQSPTEVKVRVDQSAIEGGGFSLVLNDSFTDDFQIDKIIPAPDQWQLGRDGMHLRFRAGSSKTAGTVHFYLKPQAFGTTSAAIGLEGEPPVRMRHFIHP